MTGRVLIAGCGDLGTEIGLRLHAAGHPVTALRRDPTVLPAAFDARAADLTRDGGLPPLPDDVEVVVHAAAGARGVDGYRALYRDGLRRVLDAVDPSRLRRVLLVSSTAVYGVTDGSWVDETTPTEPARPTGGAVLEAERVAATCGAPAVVLRLAGIYGPGRTRLIDQVRTGTARVPDPPTHTNRIHRDDAAAAAVHLLDLDDPPPVVLGVDDAPVDKGEVLRFLADELGLPHPPVAEDETIGQGRGGDKRCRNDLLRATGWTPTYATYREGYRSMLAGEGTRHP